MHQILDKGLSFPREQTNQVRYMIYWWDTGCNIVLTFLPSFKLILSPCRSHFDKCFFEYRMSPTDDKRAMLQWGTTPSEDLPELQNGYGHEPITGLQLLMIAMCDVPNVWCFYGSSKSFSNSLTDRINFWNQRPFRESRWILKVWFGTALLPARCRFLHSRRGAKL